MNAGSKCLTLLPLSSISFILNRDIQIPLAHDHYWVSCTIMDAATAVERALCTTKSLIQFDASLSLHALWPTIIERPALCLFGDEFPQGDAAVLERPTLCLLEDEFSWGDAFDWKENISAHEYLVITLFAPNKTDS